MSETVHLNLPYLAAAQAQKHVTVNEALARIDALVSLSVLSRTLSSPPSTPVEGDRFIVAPGGAGAWTGFDLRIAIFLNGGWDFADPSAGWRAWVADERRDLLFDGQAWIEGTVALSGGAYMAIQIASQDFALPAAASAQTQALIPDRAVVVGVTARVIETITGAASWAVGVPGAPGRYGTQIGTALNSELNGVSGSPVGYYGDTPLLIDAESGSFTGGVVRLSAHYFKLTPPSLI